MKKQLIALSLLCCYQHLTAQPAFLSRDSYRAKVEAYSQLLKQQREKTQASQLATKIAHTGFLPQISLQADGTLNLNDLRAWNEPVGEYRNHTYQGQFVVSQPLYSGGSLRAQQRMAQADERLENCQEKLTLDQLHFQSDAVYWNAAASLAMLQAADNYQQIVKEQYRLTQDRFTDGMIDRTDLLLISTRLKEAELQYIKVRQNHTLALQKLNILMGHEPEAAVDSLTRIDEPAINITKSQAQRKNALSQFNPQLSMYFSGGWATATPNLGYDVSFNPIVGIHLSVPLFQWGARLKTNRRQKALIQIQRLQQSYVADGIKEELAEAQVGLEETACQVKTATENMKLAEESLDLISFSYTEGKANMVDVLSAQISWTQARTNLINAYLAQKMAVARYQQVISE